MYVRTLERRRNTQAKRIGLLGNFGSENLGNEGSLEVMLAFLRRERPDAEIVCICRYPDSVQRSLNLPATRIVAPGSQSAWLDRLNRLLLKVPGRLFDVARTFRQVRKLDVIIIPGTGILDDFGERPSGMPYALFKWCLAARLAGCRLAFVSIGAGPIHNRTSRWLMKTAARLAHYRSYRDTISKDYMTNIGIDTSDDPVVPDVAFKLPAPEPSKDSQRPNRPLTVGVGVMDYYGWTPGAEAEETIRAAYLDKIAQFVLRSLERGYRVRLLVGELSDQAAVDVILARVAATGTQPGRDRLVSDPAFSLHDVMRQMTDTDVVVATRYHNVVCALKVEKPTISVGYAAKNDVLLDDMGLGGFYQHCERFDVDLLTDQLERLIHDRERLSARIARTSRAYCQLLEQQESRLLANWV